MDIMLSLSEEARKLYSLNPRGHGLGYMSSRFLADAFVKRGHNLTIIHPNNLLEKDGKIFSNKSFGFKDGVFFDKEDNLYLKGDVFFVYSLDEERGPESSKRFVDSLCILEKQFNFVLNTAESTSYEFKPKQKKLDLPWIPGFNVRRKEDLISLIDSGEKIISKPKIGACGQGINFLETREDIARIQDINNFFFEKYIPSDEERRYIFLDNQLIIGRKLTKAGTPGKERCINVDLIEGDNREIEIARKAIVQTGMFYGAVDFRESYLLEINGSGTGVAPPTVANELDSYNLSDPIVQAVERKLKRQ